MRWTGRAYAESCSRPRLRRATSCFCSGTSPKRSPIRIWRTSGPRRGPTCAFRPPYDTDARFRAKAGTSWTGYMVHLTESCDEGAPRLVVHTETTPANVHEAMRIEAIHAALAAKGLAPTEHLVDTGYVSAEHLMAARERYGIDLVGPARPGTSWQNRTAGAFGHMDFAVDWERRIVRCPEGRESTGWREYHDDAHGRYIRARFDAADCHTCPSKSRCTRGQGQGRQLTLNAREPYEALAAARARLDSEPGRRLYAQRQGIEGTISQSVRAFGLRRARYRGLAKAGLQNVAAAAALNFDRLAAWFTKRPLAPTSVSRFAALAA